MADEKKSGVSRRDLLKRAGMAGAAMTIPLTPVSGGDAAAASTAPRRRPTQAAEQTRRRGASRSRT